MAVNTMRWQPYEYKMVERNRHYKSKKVGDSLDNIKIHIVIHDIA
jgi:hypothetical protein